MEYLLIAAALAVGLVIGWFLAADKYGRYIRSLEATLRESNRARHEWEQKAGRRSSALIRLSKRLTDLEDRSYLRVKNAFKRTRDVLAALKDEQP